MRKWIMICAALCFLMGKAGAQQNGAPASVYNTDHLVAGERTQIIYNPSQTPLAGAKEVNGIVYLWKDYEWTADEVALTRRDSCWVGTYQVPLGTALICAVFQNGDVVDKGGRSTYAQMTFNPETNANYPSAYAGWGILRNPLLSETYGVPNFCDTTNSIGDDVMFFWISQQLRYFPGERANVLKYAIPLLKTLGQDSLAILKTLREEATLILNNAESTERQLMDARQLVRQELRDDSLLLALEAKTLEKFPKGLLARNRASRKIIGMKNEERVPAIQELIRQFPPALYVGLQSEDDKFYYDMVRGYVYTPVVEAKNYSAVYEQMKASPSWLLSTYFWHLVHIPYRNGEAGVEKLEPLATALIQEMLVHPREGAERLLTPSEHRKQVILRNADHLFVYAQLLAKHGRYAEALGWVDKIQPRFGYKDAPFNEFRANLYAKYAEEIIPLLENSVGENAATQSMLDRLKKDYVARTKSARGFEAYVDGLKKPELLEAMREKIMKSMIKEKVADFSVTDLKGKTLSSASMKGKIIIIDFWATWCAPCKAALPAMQMLVNKYAKDKGVDFYFVTTQERPAGLTEKVRKYVEEKGFENMKFVCDLPGKDKTNDKFYEALAKQFHFSGIPIKVAIDGDGYLRWYSCGYNGNPTELVDEISFVIEEIKKEGK